MVTVLEASPDNPDTICIAQGLATKLKTLDAEFKTHHLSIIDLTYGEEALVEEQEALDNHDDQVSELNVRIQRLVSSLTTSPVLNLQRSSLRRLTRLREKLASIEAVLTCSNVSRWHYSGETQLRLWVRHGWTF